VTSGKFNLAASGLAGARITTLTGGGSVWIVSADPGYGSGSLGLNLVDDDAIVDAVGNPLGGTGAGNGNFTGEVYTVTTPALAGYSMDEVSWNGSAGEVVDQSGNFSGTAKNNGTTGGLTPALSGTSGSCRYGIFTSAASPVVTKGFIELTAGFPYLSTSFTIAGWVRTTSNATSNQWIFTHNTGGLGYALSLGTPGAGRLRFSSGGAATPNLDSPSGAPSLLANNTWYFVAAVADFSGDPNIVRTLYVFDASGNLLSGYPVSLSSTGWDDTESGLASIGGDGNSSFAGLLDEIQFYDKTLNQAALTALAQARHPCSALVPDHYELTLPSSSLTCLPSTLTLTACSNASSPCTSAFTGAVGATATLSSSAGNLGASSFTFDATGIVSTTLSHPAAANGTAVSVTLTGTSLAAGNGSQCCPNGSSCSASSSCSTTFNSAGFMFTSAADATTVATIPAQVAGTSSGSFTLRAVRTNTSTKACESALVGANTVNWAVQCNNPTSCSAGSLMSLTGSSTVAIASNPNSGVGNTTAVPMVFDANGNAPFSFNYADVGQVTLWASKSVNSAALAGASNAFVVKPGGFTVSAIQQTSAPGLSNPAAANAGGARFVKAGESFSATVTARTSGGATTPNFGHEIVPEGVLLASQLVQPSGGAAGSLDNASIAGSAFSSGVATVSNLAYSEVGIITLTPSVADGDYLGAGAVSGSASVNVGRFVPAKFALSGGTATHRSALACSPAASFSYLGENFRLGFTLTAQNLAGGTTANYTGSFAKLDPTVAANWNLAGLGGSTTFSTGSGRLSLGSSTGSWAAGVVAGATITANASRAASPDGPFAASFGIAPTDSDGVAMAAYDLATTSGGASDHTLVTALNLRFGRLRLSSAIGAADRVLSLPVLAQYWTGTAFDVNTLDSCTALPTTALSFGNLRRTLTTADTTASGPVTLAAGVGTLRLAAPGGGRSGTFDIALSLGAGATDASCLQPWTPGAGDVATAGANLAYLRGAWCGSTYDKDPSARASFGMQRTQDYLVYRRENF
jgi:MSHA biogenesis protein MshQ